MDIEIKKLIPDLAEDYVRFFDTTPHSERPDDDECKCYCVWWCKDDQNDMVFNEFLSSPERRRNYALQNIKENNIQGYLAYCDGKVVGWCNANTKADCLKCFCWRRFMGSISTNELASDVRVKSVFCFLITPEFRKKGITKLILERVCQDAANENFEYVEAYPKKVFINEAVDFMGSLAMYEKCGFTEIARHGDRIVMRKDLNSTDETDEERQARIYPIILSEYDPAWAEWYAEEKENLERLIGAENIARISHFGSTSVPGLTAKPTVDILIEISDDATINKLIASLSMPDYIYLHQESAPTISTPSLHLMFLKGYLPDGFAEKVYHIHVVRSGDWDEKLCFRDYLISHPQAAAEYAELKRNLNKDYKYYRDGYTEAKSKFIKEITDKARELL